MRGCEALRSAFLNGAKDSARSPRIRTRLAGAGERQNTFVMTLIVVASGRLGADRSALEWAIGRGLEHRGWCGLERSTPDGPVPLRYRVREVDAPDPSRPVEWNVRDSDATVIFSLRKDLAGLSKQAMQSADVLRRPWLHLHYGVPFDPASRLAAFLRGNHVGVLHVTGSGADEEPGVCEFTRCVLERAWGILTEGIPPAAEGAGAREKPVGNHNGAGAVTPYREIPALRTARLLLRPFTPADAECVQRFLTDPTLTEGTLHVPEVHPVDGAERWIDGHGSALREGVWHWAVTLTDGKLAGAVTLFVSAENARGSIAYWIVREARGQGIAAEAVRRVIGFGFAHLRLHCVEGAHLEDAPEAGHVFENSGMAREGRLRGHVRLARDSRFHDVVVYGVLNPLCADNATPVNAAAI